MLSIDQALSIIQTSMPPTLTVLEQVALQTLKTAVLAQQTNNKQSTPCACKVADNSGETTVLVCKFCGGQV